MKTELRKQSKNDFEKDFFKLMNNSVFRKTVENVINVVYLAIEMKMTKVKMNKPVYLALSILEISKTLMYEFWYDYMKPKYGDNVKLCYMDTDSIIMHIRTEDFYKDIANDVEKRFDTTNYEVSRPLPT